MPELEEPQEKSRLGLVILLVAILVGVGAIGAVGYISGAGWFGYRQIMYGDGQIYLLNMGDSAFEVTVEGREPVVVPPEDARIVDVVGGESQVVVRTHPGLEEGGEGGEASEKEASEKEASEKEAVAKPEAKAGEVVERRTVFLDNSHALLKLTDDGCLAASDVGAFYGRGGEGLEFVEMIEADQRLYVPGTTNIIWPRQDFPKKLDREGGDALWVELVGCPLLEQPEFLRAYLDVRLGSRLGQKEGEGEGRK